MIERNICPVPGSTPRAVSQTIADTSPSEDTTLSTWLLDHGPLILGSALGMFASNIFLYAFQNGGLRATVRVSLQFLSSLPSRINRITVAASRSLCRTYVRTSQLSRHVYLLALCAFCQAVILPCLVVSQLLGLAALAWFGALRVLYSALRIVSKVAFGVLVVSTGLECAFGVASKAVTSYLRSMRDWTTDLHNAAVVFVGGPQPTLSSINSDRADRQPAASSMVAPSRSTVHSLIGVPRRPTLDPGRSTMKKGATTAEFIVAHEVDVTHEGSRCRFPIRTIVRLRLSLADKSQSGNIDSSRYPGEVDVLRPIETNVGRDRFGDRDLLQDEPIEARLKDILGGRPSRSRGKAIEKVERVLGKQSPTPIPRMNRRHSGWARQDDSPMLRSPPITSPEFWYPPGVAVPETL